MKRSTLMIALGGKPAADDDEEVAEGEGSEDDTDADTDEAIKTFLDPEADMDTRVAAFRAAVKGCY